MDEITYLVMKNDYNSLATDRYMYVSKLKELYPQCVHDKTSQDKYNKQGHSTTYGEMEYDGFDKIMQFFSKERPDAFLDIGCGRGKLCLYANNFPNIQKSIGIEIVRDRYLDALNLLENVQEYPYSTNINFINDDFRNFDVSQIYDHKPFVWISNLCFNQQTTNDIFNIILDKFPTGTVIGCSKQHTLSHPKLMSLGTVNIEMSWSKSNVHCYKII